MPARWTGRSDTSSLEPDSGARRNRSGVTNGDNTTTNLGSDNAGKTQNSVPRHAPRRIQYTNHQLHRLNSGRQRTPRFLYSVPGHPQSSLKTQTKIPVANSPGLSTIKRTYGGRSTRTEANPVLPNPLPAKPPPIASSTPIDIDTVLPN